MKRNRIFDLLLGVAIGLFLALLIFMPLLSSCHNLLDGCIETAEKMIEDWGETLDLANECLDDLENYRQAPATPNTPGTDSW